MTGARYMLENLGVEVIPKEEIMTNTRHPLYHAICLWASEPDKWVWQIKAGNGWSASCGNYPPSITQFPHYTWRLVHDDWLRDPESVMVYVRPRGSNGVWQYNENPVWDHEQYEYRVEPRKRTGRMTEAPEVGTKYWAADPMGSKWCQADEWVGTSLDRRLLERGLCYHDADSAIAAAKRMSDNARQGTTGDDER